MKSKPIHVYQNPFFDELNDVNELYFENPASSDDRVSYRIFVSFMYNINQNFSIHRNTFVAGETKLSVTTKKIWLLDRRRTECAESSFFR